MGGKRLGGTQAGANKTIKGVLDVQEQSNSGKMQVVASMEECRLQVDGSLQCGPPADGAVL
eukprot:1435546-Alexandrium_andersonii.AAC.1